ncbi:MAG: hypothetical protein OIF32_09700 [Campylobacterales bacterium]|nr:hypothetical protein [Campylobacterales bacterium]
MLSVNIDNPNVESFLQEKFSDDKTGMSRFLTDFIEKEIIKKDLKDSFSEFKLIVDGKKEGGSLDDLISKISPDA